MSLKDLLSLADDKLAETFNRKKFDIEKARERHLKSIDLTKEQYGRAEPVRGRKSWKAANNVVEYAPPFELEEGKSHHYVPSERFENFLEKLRNLITSGHFDKQIEARETDAAGVPKIRPTPTGDKPKRAGWSPERRARQEASYAARRAAKGG